jgi:hypothetical protein
MNITKRGLQRTIREARPYAIIRITGDGIRADAPLAVRLARCN